MLNSLLRLDIILIIIYIATFFYFVYRKNDLKLKEMLIASLVSVVWILISNKQYGYNQNFITVLGYQVFPVIAWSLGLFISIHLFSLSKTLKRQSFYLKFLAFVLLYWIALIAIETVGYHYLFVHNNATAQYSGLPYCDCMHAPHWMQISYFSLGIIYYLIIKKQKTARTYIKSLLTP